MQLTCAVELWRALQLRLRVHSVILFHLFGNPWSEMLNIVLVSSIFPCTRGYFLLVWIPVYFFSLSLSCHCVRITFWQRCCRESLVLLFEPLGAEGHVLWKTQFLFEMPAMQSSIHLTMSCLGGSTISSSLSCFQPSFWPLKVLGIHWLFYLAGMMLQRFLLMA